MMDPVKRKTLNVKDTWQSYNPRISREGAK